MGMRVAERADQSAGRALERPRTRHNRKALSRLSIEVRTMQRRVAHRFQMKWQATRGAKAFELGIACFQSVEEVISDSVTVVDKRLVKRLFSPDIWAWTARLTSAGAATPASRRQGCTGQ